MGKADRKNISFPRYAEYNCAFKYIVEQAMNARFVMPPALTKRTMELGTKYSPDFVCTPFKTLLGSMIEALEAGADTLRRVVPYLQVGDQPGNSGRYRSA